MPAVFRDYSARRVNTRPAFLVQHKTSVDTIYDSIKGIVSYTAAHSDSASFTMTLFENKAGTDESVVGARVWLDKNAASLGSGAPTITDGPVALDMK